MLNTEFKCIILTSSADFGKTNLVEMDLPTLAFQSHQNLTLSL